MHSCRVRIFCNLQTRCLRGFFGTRILRIFGSELGSHLQGRILRLEPVLESLQLVSGTHIVAKTAPCKVLLSKERTS